MCGERGKEKLERRIRAASAERGREREKEKERGKVREREGRKKREKKRGRRRAGSCWARAASDLLRRDHRTPGVATALPASLAPSSFPSDTFPRPLLAARKSVLFLSAPPPSQHLLEKNTNRRDGLYEISST